jgi:hypothetical protein
VDFVRLIPPPDFAPPEVAPPLNEGSQENNRDSLVSATASIAAAQPASTAQAPAQGRTPASAQASPAETTPAPPEQGGQQ